MPLPPVLYADDELVAFDQPGVAPGEVAGLGALVRREFGAETVLASRPDPEVSGVVLYARSRVARDYLSGQFQARTVRPLQLALVTGIPAMDTFIAEYVLKDDEARPGRLCVVKKHGQPTRTEFAIREKFPAAAGRSAFAFVEARPDSGRPHQVRLHLATTGTPVLNDAAYGNEIRLLLSGLKRGYKGRADERPLISRLALHTAALTFRHPRTREPQTIEAPLPNDFAVALKYLRKFAAPR
ncbi:MAG TPA: pseudouridine synthase [Lacunisphaera sp.]|nr:pseudouridine synthase [Lacunisphaera sp.]